MIPPNEVTGSTREAAWLNKLLRFCRSLSIQDSPDIRVVRSTNGVTLEVARRTSSSSSTSMYRVTSVQDDYILAKKFDGTSVSGSDVKIAKPYDLRKTGWHGVTVSYPVEPYPGAPSSPLSITYSYISSVYRTATGATTGTEHQVIIPRYVANKSVIFASAPDNGTGVSEATLIDLNADGRAWAKVA